MLGSIFGVIRQFFCINGYFGALQGQPLGIDINYRPNILTNLPKTDVQWLHEYGKFMPDQPFEKRSFSSMPPCTARIASSIRKKEFGAFSLIEEIKL